MLLNLFKKTAASVPSLDTCNSVLSLRNISVNFAERQLLKQVNLDFYQGELTILLGPNGTGKSSLLKTISEEINFTGHCYFYGQPINNWDKEQLAKHLGILPQHSQLTFNFTAQEVVELGALNLNLSHEAQQELVAKSMQLTDILHLKERNYPSLSGGEKQRVHLARVLTQLAQSGDKKVLLMDEPTSALDIQHQHRTLKLAKSIAKAGGTVIVVLHDLNLAAQYADRVVILNNGEIVANANPKQAIQAEIIEQVYLHPVKVIEHPQTGHPVVLS